MMCEWEVITDEVLADVLSEKKRTGKLAHIATQGTVSGDVSAWMAEDGQVYGRAIHKWHRLSFPK